MCIRDRSYTSFAYSGLTLSRKVLAPGKAIEVLFTVENTGAIDVYKRQIQNSLILLRNTDTNPLAARLLSISLFFSLTKPFQIINLKTRKTRFKMVI